MSAPGGAESLPDLLTLETLDTNLYRARNPANRGDPRPRLFGGQVAAQALAAAAATVDDDRPAHSLHGYFLRLGRPDRPTIITVDRDRDGRSFSARHVNARQDGKVIFSALASFQLEAGTRDVQEPVLAADAGDPDTLPQIERDQHLNTVLDIRYLTDTGSEPWRATRFWVRPRDPLPADSTTRSCVLTYISDLGWPFGWLNDGSAPAVGGTSLDHAVWLHRPIDVTDWMFIDLVPVSIIGERGVFNGTIHARDGALGAYLTQEVLLRPA